MSESEVSVGGRGYVENGFTNSGCWYFDLKAAPSRI